MNATGADRTLQVQAQPAQAPQPWLPLQSLELRYTSAPTSARTGEAANVVVEAVAEGATRAQFSDLPVPDVGANAQVSPAAIRSCRASRVRWWCPARACPGGMCAAARHRKQRCRT
ncbi:hypothetical protein G6F68_018905 [Rhizopus microsporus]|nr:hypothetical protein G6F68_018905 [Rhizopus microsporus]